MEHESDLISQILLGHRELFEQIVLKYQNLVYTVCLNILTSTHDAENMAQETFLTAYSSLTNFQGGSFKSWLCRIAVNKCIDLKRQQSRCVLDKLEYFEGSEGFSETVRPAEEVFAQKERKERLEQILSALPGKYASVINAFYYNQLSIKEISRQMHMPERTVETRLYRAKKLIRERWGDDGV